MKSRKAGLVGAAVALLTAAVAFGQAVSGTINGLVSDPTGATVKAAAVIVTNTQTGVAVKTLTNDSGFYSVPNLIAGTYSVRVEAPGFKRFEKNNIVLNVDSTVRVDAPLTLGAVTETVTVSGEGELLKTEKADVSTVVTGPTLSELPVLNRNVSQLVGIMPGALRGGAAFIGENPGSDTNGFVNGLGGGNNYHQLDGIDNQETIQGVAMVNPAIDSLQEVKITTNSYDAEFGQVAGAVFQATTKSGTNQYHGSVFEYLQNDKFFARNPFTESNRNVAPWRWNQFGGDLGGPIKKDKLFFFGDYQGVRSRQGSTIQLGLPTPAFKNGDFSAVSSQYPIYDPLTGDANGHGRVQFPNNIIPTNRLDPITLKLAQMLPNPNTNDPSLYFRNYTQSGSFTSDTDNADGRIDYNLSQNTRMFGRYSFLRSIYDAPPVFGRVLGGTGFGPQAETGGTRTQNLSYDLTRVFRPDLIGEFRFGLSRFRSNLAQTDLGLKTAQQIGIPGINSGDPRTDGLPQMSFDGPISNFYIGNPFANFYELEQSLQYTTNWSAVVGSHTFKWGADLRPHAQLQRIDKSFRGSFNFSRFDSASADAAGVSGIGFASFLLGNAQSYSRGTYIALPDEFQDRYGLYAQDQWRINPRLTLTLGLRWEYFSPTYSKGQGRETVFDFASAQMVFANLGGFNKYAGVNPDYHDFAPRFGLAYTITPKTVLRMGYGRSYAINTGGANFGSYCCQWPIGDNQNITAPTLYTQIFPLAQGPPPPTNGQVQIPSSGRLSPPDGQFIMGRPFHDRTTSLDAWNITVQRQLTNSMAAEISYVGNLGRHLWMPHNANAAVPGPGPLLPRKYYGANYGLSQWIDMRSDEGNSSFHSLQARWTRQFSRGYQFMLSYTWQKTMMESYMDPFNRALYRGPTGPAAWLTISHVIDFPFGPGHMLGGSATGIARALIEGWEFTGITQFQEGSPFSPSMVANTLNVDTYSQRPNLVGDPHVSNPNRNLWFNPAAFAVPAPYTFGTAGTGILHGPGMWDADLSLDKNFYFHTPMNERTRMTFRWQLFNTFNHVNLGTPVTSVDLPASQAGHIFGTATPMRRMQIGLHLYF